MDQCHFVNDANSVINKVNLELRQNLRQFSQNLGGKNVHTIHTNLPNKADMFWKIRSSSGVIAGQFSKVTNL